MRILLIEDDKNLQESLAFQMKQEGISVDQCQDGEEGLLAARGQSHDLILLDRMLPVLDGMELLRIIRREGIQTPVIFLTALGQISDRTEGLNLGADDYMVKPFAFEELLARIHCVLRRPGRIQAAGELTYGDVQYDPSTLTVHRGEAASTLSKRLGDLLELFLRNPGQTLARETILLRVWGLDTEVEDGNLDNYIYFLRRSLRKIGSRVKLTTLRGIGYRMEENHSETSENSADTF